jgi:RNA polymerase sigma-B factor
VRQNDSDRSSENHLAVSFSKSRCPEDLNELVKICQPLVSRAARRYRNLDIYDDLLQVGRIGLINAAERFDPQAGVHFATYASHFVQGEIQHFLRDRSQTIRQPAWVQERHQKIARSFAALTAELGREPNVEQLSVHSGFTEAEVTEIRLAVESSKTTSLESIAFADDFEYDTSRNEISDPLDVREDSERRMFLSDGISQLRELEQEVLTRFHFGALKQVEIAEELGISNNYVSHILRSGHNKLRAIFEGDEIAEMNHILSEGEEQVSLDAEVGVYSGTYLRSRLVEEVHRAVSLNREMGLMIIQVVGVDRIERFYGPNSGMPVIKTVASLLKRTLRSLDIIGRHGPYGFAAILPRTGSTTKAAQERLEASLRTWQAEASDLLGGIEVLVGSCWIPEHGRTADQLISSADPTEHNLAA